MSSRQLRKLQQQKELEAQAKLQAQEEEEESEDEPVAPTKSKASLWANLAALEDEDEDDEDEELEEKADPKPVNDPAPTTAKKSKKSKKKKKAKAKGKEPVVEAKEDEDIDAALRELALQKPSGSIEHSSEPSFDPEYERVCELLGVSTNHLKVGNEMRNLFGRDVMDNHDDAGGAVPRAGRNRRARPAQQAMDLESALKGQHAPGKGLPEVSLRRNIFVQGKDDWPRGKSGLTMALVDDRSDDGTVEYTFAHDKIYQELQKSFHQYVEIGDPQNLIGLLQKNPYHISLLIQVSKIAKDQSDHSLSTDLLERALFSFARASNSGFAAKLAQGKLRLDFTRPENRELWLAAYQYVKMLVMKGTFRTALEWAKLMLSIDPEGDPYCMRLMIHNLALRSSQFKWLLDVSESKIPNIWSPTELQESRAAVHTAPSFAYAAMQLRDGVKARKLLTASMKQVPWLFARLFKEINLDAPPSIWGVEPRTDAETLFTEIYVLQTKDLWNTPEATALLMEIAHTIKQISVKAIPTLENKEMTLDVVRFVYLDNTPALMSMVPSRLLHRENNSDSDPLPPETNTFSYEAQRDWIERGQTRNGFGGGIGDYNPLAAIARMLPGFRIPRGSDDQSDDDDPQINEAQLRRELEAAVQGNAGMPVGVAQSLLNMLGWGTGAVPVVINHGSGAEDDEDDDDEFVDAEDGENTDYDDLPNLIGSEGEVGDSDTEDDMPGLVVR